MTAIVLILFYLFVINTYNLIVGENAYQLQISTNILYPLIFCTLGGSVGGFYSWKLFKPVTKDLIEDDLSLNNIDEPMSDTGDIKI